MITVERFRYAASTPAWSLNDEMHTRVNESTLKWTCTTLHLPGTVQAMLEVEVEPLHVTHHTGVVRESGSVRSWGGQSRVKRYSRYSRIAGVVREGGRLRMSHALIVLRILKRLSVLCP